MSGPVNRGTRLGFDTVELNAPGHRNALSLDMLAQLLDAVRASAAGTSRGLVLTHAGTAFCAGVDLKERSGLARSDSAHSDLLSLLLRELWAYQKPVVAMVDGATRGGGMGLLACADIVLAVEGSTFAYAEARVGVAPALVMAVTLSSTDSRSLLPHLLGAGPFDARTAQRLGLVSEVLPSRDVGALDDTLNALRSGAPGALITIKRLAREWSAPQVDRLIREMTTLSAQLFATQEAAEGMAAFAQRRPPSWLGSR